MTTTLEFRSAGACVGVDPNLFHPERGDSATVKAAKAVCDGCAVIEACLDHAIANETIGIWGGTSERERRRLRKGGRRHFPKSTVSHGEKCASNAAYARHRDHNEVVCIESQEAHRIYNAGRRDAISIGSGE